MLRFRCSGDVPKRDAAPPPPGTGRTSPNPGIATYGLPSPTSQTTSSKPRNRYIRSPQTSSQTHLPDLLQTQESLHTASQTSPPRPPPKPRNRYIRHPRPTLRFPDQPSPPPDLLHTQESLHTASQTHLPDRPRPECASMLFLCFLCFSMFFL